VTTEEDEPEDRSGEVSGREPDADAEATEQRGAPEDRSGERNGGASDASREATDGESRAAEAVGGEQDGDGEADEGEEPGGWVEAYLDRHPKLKGVVDAVAPFGTAIYFAGGVVFDAITLTHYLSLWTLGYVGLYASGVGVMMVVRARRWFETHREIVDGVLHFCLGATFSALIALYFRSASHMWAWITVILLASVMIWNEVAARRRPRRSIVWGVYAVSLVMLLNFVLPYAFKTLSAAWFYFSIVVVLVALYWLRRLARIQDMSLVSSAVSVAFLVGLHLFGAIPPVPLVMRQNIPCVEARKAQGQYVCEGTPPGLLVRAGLASRKVKYVDGERVSVMSAVSAPEGMVSTLEHRWARYVDGDWEHSDTIEVRLTGGRSEGWRFYSYKENIGPGYWRVTTAVPDGRVVGYVFLKLVEVPAGERPERRRLRLD
jgi:hypothetical protein